MKFTDGYWQIREGYKIYNPAEVRDIQIGEKSIKVFAACKTIRHRGDTLNEPLITVEFCNVMNNIIRVRVIHHAGKKKTLPVFSLNTDDKADGEIINTENEAILLSGDLSVKINKLEGWKIDYYFKEKRITGNTPKSTGYIISQDKAPYIREQLNLEVGEMVYGLGERFTPFVKNGQIVDIYNEDGGTSSEQAYKNIPFYITNKGYGVFVNHPECVSFEIGSENVSKVQFSVPGESLEYYIIGGADLKEVLEGYTRLTGKPALPPAWSFGLWLTTSFVTSYDEKTVNGFIDGMFERDIPLRVFHFDCFWMKEYQWCDYEWDKDIFPEPEKMLERLHDKGLKICVWLNPYIAQKSRLFDEGMRNGYLVKTRDGDVWQWDKWQAGMGLIDFTNPEAVLWFKEKLKSLLDMGVDCFKTDFGERIPTDVVYYDKSDPKKMHNYYTYLYNKAAFDVLKEIKGESEAVVFARSATVGCQQFPVHWGGDCSATYESMAESLRGGLSLCLSGFGFWSHDIGGFEKTATPDIYKRWVAFGLLSSHSRLHGNESYRVPWLFDEESVDVLRFFTKLKYKLMPYLYRSAVEASQKGIPLMRAMILEYPDDHICSYLDRQYMLGDSILVAPIFNEEGIASYYLPDGIWTDFLSGKKIAGGQWIEEKHSYMSLPLLVKQNSVIPTGIHDDRPDYDYPDRIEFNVFELQQNCEASAVIFNTTGQKELIATATRSGNKVEFSVEGAKNPWSLTLWGIEDVRNVKCGVVKTGGKGIIIIPENDTSVVHIDL